MATNELFCDIVTFHCVEGPSLRARIMLWQEHSQGRPVLCAGYMAREKGTTFEVSLPLFKEFGVGCLCSGLVAGRVLESGVVSIYFMCNEGSVTHYYHFFFGALVPLIEYFLSNKRCAFRIKTDIGPMKSILCEFPFNIVEICGPSLSTGERKILDDKSAYDALVLNRGDEQLPAYDSFDQAIFVDEHAPKMTSRCMEKVLAFLAEHVPPYIASIRPVRVVLIERKLDPYYQQVKNQNRAEVYNTSGAQRR